MRTSYSGYLQMLLTPFISINTILHVTYYFPL